MSICRSISSQPRALRPLILLLAKGTGGISSGVCDIYLGLFKCSILAASSHVCAEVNPKGSRSGKKRQIPKKVTFFKFLQKVEHKLNFAKIQITDRRGLEEA